MKEFFVQHMPIYNNLLHFFFPGVIIEEKQMSIRTPFFAEIRLVFHGGQFQILGDFWLFLAEVVESNLRNLWGDLSYL
jgi:hypothetical protein